MRALAILILTGVILTTGVAVAISFTAPEPAQASCSEC